jgi:hypothetical protein
MTDLTTHRVQVIASISGSTCAVDFPELAQFVELHLVAAQGRSEAAIQRSHERSLRLRQGIKLALGSLKMDWPLHQLAGVVHKRMQAHPETYGLNAGPSLTTIRDEIYKLKENAGFGSEVKIGLCYASTSSST